MKSLLSTALATAAAALLAAIVHADDLVLDGMKKPLRVRHDGPGIVNVAWSPDGKRLARPWGNKRGRLRPVDKTQQPTPPENPGFIPLFNGKDLAGWKRHENAFGDWEVSLGILRTSGQGGGLFTQRDDYNDFQLRVEARLNTGAAWLMFRTAYDPMSADSIGYHVEINEHERGFTTGSLVARKNVKELFEDGLIPANKALTHPGEWFILEVLAQGDLVTVKVNGTKTAELLDKQKQHATSGHIALFHFAKAVIEYRKIEIKESQRK